MRLADLPTPALLLDLDVLERNLAAMAERTRRLGVALRPHAKTHKCVEVARRQREHGARGLTVSTLEEARAFADHGFADLTWAFPVVPGRLGEARALARQVRLGLLVDSRVAIDLLEARGDALEVFLEVDCGDHRSGIDPESPLARELAARLAGSPSLRFRGLLTHSGQAYRAHGHTARAAVAETERAVMDGLARRLRAEGIEVPEVSVGSTPAMSAAVDLTGVTEARPGNYALHDLTQVALGTCRVADCAATVLASVVSSVPGSGRSVIDAGALALSKDPGPGPELAGDLPPVGMGALFASYAAGTLRRDARVVALSQEHGVVDRELAVGSRVRILPHHSCLAVACFDAFHGVRGEEVVERWKIWRGR